MTYAPTHTYTPGEILTAAQLRASLAELAAYVDTSDAGEHAFATAVASLSAGVAVDANKMGPNVKRDFGAVGDNTTDDRAAFQSALTWLAANGGGTLNIPVGNFKIGSPGIVWPQNCQQSITFAGHSPGGAAANSTPTRLFRTGAYPILTAIGTGTDLSVNTYLIHGMNLRDLFIDGMSQSATLVNLQYTANSFWERVTLKLSAGLGLNGNGLWNDHFTDCYFTGNGNTASQIPSIRITDPGIAGLGAGTNTVHFTSCEHEGNRHDDVHVTGVANPSTGVMFTGNKHERCTGAAIRFNNVQGATVIGGTFYHNNTGSAAIIQNGGSLVSIVGNTFKGSSPSVPANFIQLAAGSSAAVVANTFLGGLCHIRIDAGFGDVAIGPNASDSFNAPIYIVDSRTTKTGTVMGRNTLQMSGGLGVYGAAPPGSRPNVTGTGAPSGSALKSLLTALASMGLVTDGSSA